MANPYGHSCKGCSLHLGDRCQKWTRSKILGDRARDHWWLAVPSQVRFFLTKLQQHPEKGECTVPSSWDLSFVPSRAIRVSIWANWNPGRPAWLATEFVQDPFVLPSAFATHLLHEPGKEACLWNFDWFHTMHLGVLKYFLGSALALLSEQEDSGQVDGRFSALSAKYRLWCHQNSQRAHVTKISKESIGWDTTSSFPTGTWHKGSLSTVLMDFVEAKLSSETFPSEPLLGLAADACKAIQRCSRIIYRSSLWLEPAKCKLGRGSWVSNFYGGMLNVQHWPKTMAGVCSFFNQSFTVYTILWSVFGMRISAA